EAIFMAIGGQPIVPNLPGIDQAITAESVLKGEHDLHDQKIVIIGGGVTGLETAETLAKDNQVTVIEMANQVGTTLYASYRGVLLKEMHDMGITIKTEHRLTHIEDHQVYTKHGDEDVAFEADTVVLAMGVKPKREALEDFEKVFDQVILLGDTDHPGQIREALHSAYDRAFVFDLG
ncbi:MAG: FAD-dependent oxidoreductase, partial [Intestinibaculum porci]